MRKVGVLIFDEVEVLDFAGPFEVFSVSLDEERKAMYDVALISEKDQIVKARNNFLVKPNFTINNAPKLDILLIPGGFGTRVEMYNEKIKDWIKSQFPEVELLLSVCTGSLVLATCGLLENLSATTHYAALDELKKASPSSQVIEKQKFVDNGKIITSAGISAGIEMSLHVIAKQHGLETAKRTARYMEYDWEGNY